MKEKRRVGILAVLVGALGAPSALADAYEVSWYTFDGGGAMRTSGGAYELSGTIGQADANPTPASGGTYELTGGFWAVALPPCSVFAPVDFDRDCDVDKSDLAVFESCASGPGMPHASTPDCDTADFDLDQDVDQDDFGGFQRCFSKADAPAGPDCSD